MTATNIFYNFVGFRYSPPILNTCKGSKFHFRDEDSGQSGSEQGTSSNFG